MGDFQQPSNYHHYLFAPARALLPQWVSALLVAILLFVHPKQTSDGLAQSGS